MNPAIEFSYCKRVEEVEGDKYLFHEPEIESVKQVYVSLHLGALSRVRPSNQGYIVRIEPGNKPGWYKLAAEFYELPGDDERGWHKLAARFKHPSGS